MVKVHWHTAALCSQLTAPSPDTQSVSSNPELLEGLWVHRVVHEFLPWGVRLDGLISACSNRLVRLGGRSIKKVNERTWDLPSLRTAKFLTSLKKCVTAMAKLSGTTFKITCICTAKNWREGRATLSEHMHKNTYFVQAVLMGELISSESFMKQLEM